MRTSIVVMVALFSAASAAAEPPSEVGPRGRPAASGARVVPSAGAAPSALPARLEDRRRETGEQGRDRVERLHERFKGARERHERVRKLRREVTEDLRKPNADPDALKKKLHEFDAMREDRRHQHRLALRQRWGQSMAKDDVKAELERHARRSARLQRLEIVAATERKGEPRKRLLDRIVKLRELEEKRHEQAMRSMVPNAPAANTSAAAADAPASAVAVPAPSSPPAPAASGVTP